ncbi:hypothetical protein [Nocardia sp. NPDC049707]|uniref:hypothetical protein n=1 Tax=Nocardia sp. NPDC049707 TaxID=3154735 RepID=UPI00343D026F
MFDSFFSVGDAITWWTDSHEQGVDPDAPEAVRRTGVIIWVHRNPSDDSQIVANSVECQGALGSYLVIVQRDWRHRPMWADQGG